MKLSVSCDVLKLMVSDLLALALTRLRVDMVELRVTLVTSLQTLTLTPGVLPHCHAGTHLVTQPRRQSAPIT